ncbi:protein disulfide-isomerase precursor, partial [Nowakowskiella sp. JEL0078]
FAPEFETIASILKSMNLSSAKVDCIKEGKIATEQVIRVPGDYTGNRNTYEIISAMRRKSLPTVSILNSEELIEFSRSDIFVTVGFFENLDEENYKNYEVVAKSLHDKYMFAASFNKSTIATFNTTSPSIIVFKQFESTIENYSGDFSVYSINEFININSFPLFDEMYEDNYVSYLQRGLPLAQFFYEELEDREKYTQFFRRLAQKHQRFAFVSIDAKIYGNHANTLNLKQEWPAFAIKIGNFSYPFNGRFSEDEIEVFIHDVSLGRRPWSIKSEEEKGMDGNVVAVVGNNYDELVLGGSTKKDVFIKFYAR